MKLNTGTIMSRFELIKTIDEMLEQCKNPVLKTYIKHVKKLKTVVRDINIIKDDLVKEYNMG